MSDCFKTVAYQPDWGPLRVEIGFTGMNFSVYKIILWEAHANVRVMEWSGNNQNNADDSYVLPTPNEQNKGRSLDCKTSLTFISDDSQQKNHAAVMKLYQGNDPVPVCVATEEYIQGANAHAEGNLIIRIQ